MFVFVHVCVCAWVVGVGERVGVCVRERERLPRSVGVGAFGFSRQGDTKERQRPTVDDNGGGFRIKVLQLIASPFLSSCCRRFGNLSFSDFKKKQSNTENPIHTSVCFANSNKEKRNDL